MSERLAIVGGTGFVSGAIARHALAVGHTVRLFHRGRRPDTTGAEAVHVDRAEPRFAIELARFAPSCVVDTYAMTAEHAADLVRATHELDARLVVLSSQDVYAQFGRLNGLPAGPPEPRVHEGSPLTIPFPFRGVSDHPAGPDYDKKEVERIVTARALAHADAPGTIVLRLPAVTGEGDPKRRFGSVVDAIDRGERTFVHRGGGTFRWSHTDVHDVARACIAAAAYARRGATIWNVAELEVPTMRERAGAIADAMDVRLDWQEGEPSDALFDVAENDLVVDDTALRRALGWSEQGTFASRAAQLVEALRRTR